MSLARKYRPKKFSELAAQDAIVQALQGSLKVAHPPQAFLFSGIRGTGKTTLARLFAATLNCENPQGCEDCPSCTHCEATREGIHEDVIEIDGASHNSVEDVRSLRETVLYLPKRAQKKIFIIDEVHMLSKSAFNALLKTLEEPPKHVVFIFATTELTKLPETIIGRCQTFHLRRIPHNLIVKRMQDILAIENVSYDIEALNLIAQKGEGSLRDALSLLDQALALGAGSITLDATRSLMAYVPFVEFVDLWNNLMHGSPESIFASLEELHEKGHETKMLANHLALTCRNGWLLKSLPADSMSLQKLSLTAHELSLLEKSSEDVSFESLSSLFKALITCLEQLVSSSLDRYILENTLLEWHYCQASTQQSPQQHISSQPLNIPEEGVKGSFQSPDISEAVKKSPQPLNNPQPASHQTPLESLAQSQQKVSQVKSPAVTSPVGPSSDVPRSATLKASTSRIPKTWQELLSDWQKLQPLQTADLSYGQVTSYGENLIELSVDPQTSWGKALLNRGHLLTKNLQEIYHFRGIFRTIPLSSGASSVSQSPSSSSSQPSSVAGNIQGASLGEYISETFEDAKLVSYSKKPSPKR
ncbi:MAG: DNA polymerase III subunit gamma/tau [Proteobacteria bacterium]|nr:DNA polymerase III subunit gamma/tau [Pseudomonadota bacterium]